MTTNEGDLSDQTDTQSRLSNGDEPSSLRALCVQLHEQVEAFLQEDFQEEILQHVQSQCRNSLQIISEALQRYP